MRVGGDLAGDDHLQSLLGTDGQGPDLALPDNAVDGGALVLQGQIDVTVGVMGNLREFAAQADETVGALEGPLQREGEFGNRVRLRIAVLIGG